MSLFGLGSTKSKSWIDPKTSAAQWGNYEGAQNINPTYSPTSAGLIGQYMNPYETQAIQGMLGDLDYSRQMAVNQTGDAAGRAGAFGGSRHGVAETLTNEGYARQGGLLSAQMRAQGFNTALGAAQDENRFSYAYPLQRQGLLNQTLAGIEPMRTGKQSGSGQAIGDFGKILSAGASVASMFSDVRLKADIEPLGERDGYNWYSYRYVWEDERREGVMAQEVALTNPSAVRVHESGYLMVDYGAL